MTAAAKHKKDGEASEGPTHHDKSAGAGGSKARQCTSPYRTPVLPHALSYYTTCVSPMRVRSLAALTKARESLASAHRARAAGEDLSSRAHTQTVSCGAVGGDASNGSQAANSSSNLGTLASLRHRRHWPPPARLRMPCLGQRGRGVRRHSSHFFFRILCLQNPVAVATQGSRRHYLLFTPCSHMYMCMCMCAHTCTCRTGRCRTLAEEVVLQGIGADAGGDAARPAAAASGRACTCPPPGHWRGGMGTWGGTRAEKRG